MNWIKYLTYNEISTPLYKGVDIGLNMMYLDTLYHDDAVSVFKRLETMYNNCPEVRRDKKMKIILE